MDVVRREEWLIESNIQRVWPCKKKIFLYILPMNSVSLEFIHSCIYNACQAKEWLPTQHSACQCVFGCMCVHVFSLCMHVACVCTVCLGDGKSADWWDVCFNGPPLDSPWERLGLPLYTASAAVWRYQPTLSICMCGCIDVCLHVCKHVLSMFVKGCVVVH